MFVGRIPQVLSSCCPRHRRSFLQNVFSPVNVERRHMLGTTVKTVPTEIKSPKLAEIKSVYVTFHVHAQLQRPVPTETYSPVQSFSD